MQSEWSACPPDVLQHCLAAQLDHTDNAAAACANKLWRDTFRGGAQAINITYSALRPLPASSYLQQFPNMKSVTLHHLPVWGDQKSWLANTRTQGQQYIPVPLWAGTMSQVPPTCSSLTLDHYLPRADAFSTSTLADSTSQLIKLRELVVQHGGGAYIPVEILSRQTALKSLQISGGSSGSFVNHIGSLRAVPSTLTKLQLSDFRPRSQDTPLSIQNLLHLQHLKDLDLTHSTADLHGMVSGFRGLSMLTSLNLSHTIAFGRLQSDVLPLKALQVLNLRRVNLALFTEQGSSVFLSDLLGNLSCLQELDVIGCKPLSIAPADCEDLKLSSFSFDFNQLTNPDQSCFQHYVLVESAPAKNSKPFLRMDGAFATCALENWLLQLPFWALTHLTICNAEQWPGVFTIFDDVGLQQLRVLDIGFSVFSEVKEKFIALNSKPRLTDLYIVGSSFQSYDFAECTTLVSLNVTHTATFMPVLTLPPFLTRLCLHNTLSASSDLGLQALDNLVTVKLGGRVTNPDSTRQLPSLPYSTRELDLWDGLLTDLHQLTRLTNLKKLTMPDPPTEQQLQIIRKLRQLRWLDVTGRQGMHTSYGHIIAPWKDQ